MAYFIVYTPIDEEQGRVTRWGSCPAEAVAVQASKPEEISLVVSGLEAFEQKQEELPIKEFLIKLSNLEVLPVYTDQEELTLQELRDKAIAYLSSTDWYVVRESETGKPIPDEVKIKRAEARSFL